MKDIKKEYTNGEITVVWQPDLCIHSKKCWNPNDGLPEVFNPRERPWVKPLGAATERIKAQVEKCPSGALSYYMNQNKEEAGKTETLTTIVEVTEKGPLLVYGEIIVKDANGCETRKNKTTAFCRCGHSKNKPFCDGSHSKVEWA